MREEKKLSRVKYSRYCQKLNFRIKPFTWRTFSLNNEAQNTRQAFFQIILGCHISNYLFLPEGCAELITDPRKVFDSFSVFAEPISYQRIFHLVSVFYITAHLVKYYFRNTAHFDFGSTGDRLLSKSTTRRFWDSRCWFFYRLPSLSNWVSIIELHKGIFCLRIHHLRYMTFDPIAG